MATREELLARVNETVAAYEVEDLFSCFKGGDAVDAAYQAMASAKTALFRFDAAARDEKARDEMTAEVRADLEANVLNAIKSLRTFNLSAVQTLTKEVGFASEKEIIFALFANGWHYDAAYAALVYPGARA